MVSFALGKVRMFESNRTQVKSQSFVLFPGVGENGSQRMPPASIYGELSTLACSRGHMRFLPCRYFITVLGPGAAYSEPGADKAEITVALSPEET